MAQIVKFINNVTPLDADHLNKLVNTLNDLVDKNETTQNAIENLNGEIQNIDALRSQLGTIENTVDEHIENCSGGDKLDEDSVYFSHLSQELKQMYVSMNNTTEAHNSTYSSSLKKYTKRANLKFTSQRTAGWCQVRIPLNISDYPVGNLTIEIESYWKSTDGSSVPNNMVFYNTVYTCADDGSTEANPRQMYDFPNLNIFSQNQSQYSGSVTIYKRSSTKYVNIYTIPKGEVSGVPHTAEIGVTIKINDQEVKNFEFKEGMLKDVVEISYITDSVDNSENIPIKPTPNGIYFYGNYIDVNGKLLTDILNSIMNSGSIQQPQRHIWYGKKANFLGDSITQGIGTTKTYHSYLKESLSLTASRNYGISGSSISNRNTPMYERCLTMDNDVDINFVFGGTNDFYFGVPLGEWYTTSGQNRTLNKDITTFKGALNTLCCNLINKYPSKQIVLLTPLHRNTFSGQPTEYQPNSIGIYFEEYVKCIIEAGKIHSIPVWDLYSESGLRPSENASAALYFTNGDKLHPIAAGHQRISKFIESKLESLPVL